MRYCNRIRSLSISQSVSEGRVENAGKPDAGLLQLLLHNRLIRIKISRINSYVSGLGRSHDGACITQ